MGAWPDDPRELFDARSVRAISTHAYPAFLRSDQSADKHSYAETCLVNSAADVMPHAYRIAEHNFCCDIWPSSFYLRELLPVRSSFEAFAGRLPVGVEARTFLHDGRVECVHPYWPEAAIDEWLRSVESMREDRGRLEEDGVQMTNAQSTQCAELPADWRRRLQADHHTIRACESHIRQLAGRVARHIGQHKDVDVTYWSADFLMDVSGRWWLTDMARGNESYHRPGCTEGASHSTL